MGTLYFDDLEVGYATEVGEYELARDEIVEFARRWDPFPFHVDEEAANASVFGGLTASSVHIFAVCTRLFHQLEDGIAIMAMLGKDEMRFPNPARVGDRLTYRTECIEKRASRSRVDRGIIRLGDTLRNQSGLPVLEQTVTLLVARKTA